MISTKILNVVLVVCTFKEHECNNSLNFRKNVFEINKSIKLPRRPVVFDLFPYDATTSSALIAVINSTAVKRLGDNGW